MHIKTHNIYIYKLLVNPIHIKISLAASKFKPYQNIFSSKHLQSKHAVHVFETAHVQPY